MTKPTTSQAIGYFAGLALAIALPAAAAAQAALEETLTPEPRPYPWKILDIQPGEVAMDAVSMFQERMAIVMAPEEVQVRVQSPEGREMEFAFAQRMMTQGIAAGASRGNDPYIVMQTTNATAVMGNRVLAIHRTQRSDTTEMPEPAALRAQIEGLYGPPSLISFDGMKMKMTYLWGEDGFISDLADVAEKEMRFDPGDGNMKTLTYRPCEDTDVDLQYRFNQVRPYAIAPGCLARFEVSFTGGARLSQLSFNLKDFDLARQQQVETDRQIIEALTGGRDVAPSNLDL